MDHVDPDVYVLRGWENPKYIAEPVLVAVERSIRDPWTDGGADPNIIKLFFFLKKFKLDHHTRVRI